MPLSALPFGLNAEQIFKAAFSTVEIRTALSPPVTIDLNAPADPENEAVLRMVQPAITLTGPAGTFQVAPYGVPSGISSEISEAAGKVGAGGLLGLAGVILLGAAILR